MIRLAEDSEDHIAKGQTPPPQSPLTVGGVEFTTNVVSPPTLITPAELAAIV